MADFRPGDTLITISYGNSPISKAIQFYQCELLGHPDPAWRSTHAETILTVGSQVIVTGSQTFPIAKRVVHNKAKIQVGLLGDRPKYALFRFRDYSNVVSHPFEIAMQRWWKEKIGDGEPLLKRWWGAFYDVGQLLMYPINWVRHKLGAKGVVAWLEKTHANVCSDACASSYRAGLTADGKQEDYIFEGISSSRVAPSHFWVEKVLMRIL